MLGCFFSVSVQAADLDQVILKADEIRNPPESFEMNIKVKTQDQEYGFLVVTSGNEKTLIKTKFPIKDKGRNMLMLGTDMWLFIPNLNRSVRIALNQKLNGEVANGDISRLRWHQDYKPSLLSESPEAWTILLEENKKGLTYPRLEVKIEKKTYRPLFADYMGISGRKLKRATFSDYKMLAGKLRPSKITIQDLTNETKISNIEISSIEVKKVDDSVFSKERLND
ncbi:MAG: hypothetical protein OM95_08845 [Bdellovibrio sp. ArHS]|nr:MAG: hypothetical protein OM95_08845 [Bdellovibrio sp. ArHS]